MSDKPETSAIRTYAQFGADKSTGTPAFTTFVNSKDARKMVSMVENSKNCVALTFSRCLGANIHSTINYLKQRGFIRTGKDLENDTYMDAALDGLKVAKVCTKAGWSSACSLIRGKGEGRYFCVNHGPSDASKKFVVHAFTVHCSRHGGLAVHGNNQDTSTSRYESVLKANHRVTVHGPFPRAH